MSDVRAIIQITECSCNICHTKWTEQTIISRTRTGYSYYANPPAGVLEGVRGTTRIDPFCYRCTSAPISQMGWVDHPKDIPWYDVMTDEMKTNLTNKLQKHKRVEAKKLPDKAKEQAKINDLLKL